VIGKKQNKKPPKVKNEERSVGMEWIICCILLSPFTTIQFNRIENANRKMATKKRKEKKPNRRKKRQKAKVKKKVKM
jgi:hypothetical protein